MKIRKGGVVISIPPTELKRYKLAGWTRVDERKSENNKKNNDKKKLKKLAKGGDE